MSIGELLKERVKVISPYPEIERHNIKVGDIITISETAMQADYLQDGCPVVAIDHKLFPLIFKPLSWWEEREAVDMPQYVKLRNGTDIWKVLEWHKIAGTFFFVTQSYKDLQKANWWNPNAFLPATEAEYNQSNTKQNT